MKNRLNLTFQKGDFAAILLVLILAVCIGAVFSPLSQTGDGNTVQIWQGGELVKELPLDNDCRFEIDGEYRNVIEIRDGYARISESDCPGADCVHSGKIGAMGRSIVCLPNRVEVRIIGTDDDVDFIVR